MSYTIRELLKGCTPGQYQAVGIMQLVPLLSDLEDDRFVPVSTLEVGTVEYGTLSFRNPSEKDVIIPAGTTFTTKKAAQDHSLHAALVKAKMSAQYRTAACIQSTQGGTFCTGSYYEWGI